MDLPGSHIMTNDPNGNKTLTDTDQNDKTESHEIGNTSNKTEILVDTERFSRYQNLLRIVSHV